MKDLGMLVAYGVSPCGNGGHSLRTRAGHCVQCNTHAIAFLRRHDESGEIYVAVSRKAGLVKIGTATDAPKRMQTLNSYAYGGNDDWTVAFRCHCEKAGQVEFLAQKSLREQQARGSYTKLNQEIECRELFGCEPAEAITAVKGAVAQIGVQTIHPSGIVFRKSGLLQQKSSDKNRCRKILLAPYGGGFTATQIAAGLGIKVRLVTKQLIAMKIVATPEQWLGMDIAKQICKEFGGTLTIDSRKHEG